MKEILLSMKPEWFNMVISGRKLYEYRNILEYVDGEYVITNPITDANLQGMRENMDESDLADFDRFVEKHWKKSIPRETVSVAANVEENAPKRRGRKPKTEI